VSLTTARRKEEMALRADRHAGDPGKPGQRGVVNAPLEIDDLDRVVRGVGDAQVVGLRDDTSVVEPVPRRVRWEDHASDRA
jgi:hypothetical protein